MVGMEVVSLWQAESSAHVLVLGVRLHRHMRHQASSTLSTRLDLHKIVLEELLQLSLSGRVREVSNVQSATLSSAGDDSLVLGGVDGLVTAGTNSGAFGRVGGLGEGGVGHLASGSVDGHGGGLFDCG